MGEAHLARICMNVYLISSLPLGGGRRGNRWAPLPRRATVSIAFLDISTPDELAAFFGLTYAELGKVIYGIPDSNKYIEFSIPKKRGAPRLIQSPCLQLKTIQRALKDALDEVYVPKASTHGFVSESQRRYECPSSPP